MKSLIFLALAITTTTLVSQAQFVTTYYNETKRNGLYSAGSEVRCAGDVNADGVPDIVIGSQGNLLSTLGFGFGFVQVLSGADGSLLYLFTGDNPGDRFGNAVDGAGDVNNDGFDDIIVGIRSDQTTGLSYGAVRVYSGFDGSILYTYLGSNEFSTLGEAVVGLGDIDGDNHDDFGFGQRENGFDPVGMPGFVYCHSGADGSLIRTFVGPTPSALANAHDVNGDGVDDLIVGQPRIGVFLGAGPGQVQVYSGSDGALLHTFSGSTSSSSSGVSVDGVGDLNGDGFDDLIVGEPGHIFAANVEADGGVRVFSGADGSVLYSFVESTLGVTMGEDVAGLGDVSQDGVPDFAVFYNDKLDPHVRVYSGADGTEIAQLPAQASDLERDMSVAGLGDIDNDGSNDVAVGAFLKTGFGTFNQTEGEVRVYLSNRNLVESYTSQSGTTASLTLDWHAGLGNSNNVEGSLVSTGATPEGLGLVLASLAPADLPIFGFDLLVAIDPTNFVLAATLGANQNGEFIVTISRRIPALAGNFMYVQMVETNPFLRASNGLKFIVIP